MSRNEESSATTQASKTTESLMQSEGFGLDKIMSTGRLKQRFACAPFSVWNTRAGDWQSRRRLWLERGILSECGRADELTYNDAANRKAAYDYLKDNHLEGSASDMAGAIKEYEQTGTLNMDKPGRKGHVAYNDEHLRKIIGMKRLSGTSIFDPVVCELCYTWWCPPEGIILDPFAGGSVRGIIASLLDRKYLGIELRPEQVKANQEQLNERTVGKYEPKWREGDSYEIVPTAPKVDFIMSCPPYGNLEVYSKDKRDVSNMTAEEFDVRYREIIIRTCDRLKENRFCAWVVSNYRTKATGIMNDFVGQTIRAFNDGGLELYNDIILINNVGTGAMRANTNMLRGARKMVKVHQNVLVFVKGDPRAAGELCPIYVE